VFTFVNFKIYQYILAKRVREYADRKFIIYWKFKLTGFLSQNFIPPIR
jgi:hypothetical protein